MCMGANAGHGCSGPQGIQGDKARLKEAAKRCAIQQLVTTFKPECKQLETAELVYAATIIVRPENIPQVCNGW